MNDIRFSLQGRYASVVDLSAFGVENTAVTLPGRALHAGDGINEAQFVGMSEGDIAGRLNSYLNRNNLTPGRGHLIILDMEPSYPDPNNPGEQISFSPSKLGNYKDDPKLQRKIINAYSLRIDVSRQVLRDKWPDGNFKFGLYGVIVPMGKGQKNEVFRIRMQGYRRARNLGMYDQVDYLVPVLFNRFGPRDVPLPENDFDIDKLNGWIEQATRQAITSSQRLTRTNGDAIPLAPLLTFWVANGFSDHNRRAVRPKTMSLQLQILREYPLVGIVVLWSGAETKEEMNDAGWQEIDFSEFLSRVDELPQS
jgi:hypothetical protein